MSKERCSSMSNYLTQETIENLCPYQVEKLNRQIKDYFETNKLANAFHIDVCPKCGCVNPQVRKNGKTKAGKQMYECKHCEHSFVADHGQLTYYSHQPQSKWNDLIIDTKNGISMKQTAATIDVHETTAFRMRHKLLHSLEKMVQPICIE